MTVPSLLAYPEVLELDDLPELRGQLVYVIRGYPLNGLAVVIHREDGGVTIQVGDWDGKVLNPKENSLVQKFLDLNIQRLVTIMIHAGIPSALFYVTYQDEQFRLVDIRTSLNKFSGPGMIRDLFGKAMATQEIRKVIHLDDRTIEAIQSNKGSYQGDLMLKASAFDTVDRKYEGTKVMFPLYAKVVR